MCGIAGIFNYRRDEPVPPDSLQTMADAMVHRGPDEEGRWVGGRVGLAHRRLSIIDLTHGQQPMSTDDGAVVVSFNGEIYNHHELRQDLEAAGVAFKTTCDTEVLLHLYRARGVDMVKALNGMFAFAIYDASERRLLLARDRMGQKPLFYFVRDGRLAFASELTALSKAPAFPRDIREQSLHDYLTYQYVPSPHTIFRGVRKLPPGHILTCSLDDGTEPEPRPFWSLDYSDKTTATFAESARRLRTLVRDAVSARLMSDVPLGAFLSGGIDSTITVGLMAESIDQPFKTFTIGFPEAKYDEQRFAEIAARQHATEHRTKVVNPQDFSVVEKLVRHYGEPYCDASMLPTYLLSCFTREHVTVALSGDGADELFGGYYRYLVMQHARVFDLCPLPVRQALARAMLRVLPPKTEERTLFGRLNRIVALAASTRENRYLDVISRFPEGLKQSVYGPRMQDADLVTSDELLRAEFARATAGHPTEAVSEVDVHTYLPGDILTKVDIASMATSLEVRSPFMDHRVVEFAASLPWRYKQCCGVRKRILTTAFGDLVPPELKRRPKMGFGVPIARWFRNEWRSTLEDVLLGSTARDRGFLDADTIRLMIRDHCELRADYSYGLWALLLFELWCRQFGI